MECRWILGDVPPVLSVPSVVNLFVNEFYETSIETRPNRAADRLDAQVARDHQLATSTPRPGCPFWLDSGKQNKIDPRKEVHGLRRP